MMKLLCSEPTAQSHDEIASCPTSPAASLFADVICPPDSISFFCSVSTWDPPRINLGYHVDRHASSGRIPKGTNNGEPLEFDYQPKWCGMGLATTWDNGTLASEMMQLRSLVSSMKYATK